MGYRKDLLGTRAEVHPGLWAVIPPDGLVNNVIPYILGCKVRKWEQDLFNMW